MLETEPNFFVSQGGNPKSHCLSYFCHSNVFERYQVQYLPIILRHTVMAIDPDHVGRFYSVYGLPLAIANWRYPTVDHHIKYYPSIITSCVSAGSLRETFALGQSRTVREPTLSARPLARFCAGSWAPNYHFMGVSINGVPKMDGLYGKILLTWMIWEYPYFRKPPYYPYNL